MPPKRDWTDLPPEVIHLISKKLPDLRYFIRCRAVCKRWFSSILLSDPPQQQLPWLIEYDERSPMPSPLKEELPFYSFENDETGSIPIQESHHGKLYHRPGHSCLFVLNGEVISLLNPLTNQEFSLPQLPSQFELRWPVFQGADPSRNSQWHIHVLFDEGRWCCATCDPEKMRWRCVDNHHYATCFLDGMLFTTDPQDCTLVLEAASGKELYTIPPLNEPDEPFFTNCYLVESCGEILRVSWEYNYDDENGEVSHFRIYKLKFGGGKEIPHWVKVSNIGDQIIFLDYHTGFSVRATAGIQGNCIYFIFDSYTVSDIFYADSTIWRYDIATGTCEELDCPFERCTCWDFRGNIRLNEYSLDGKAIFVSTNQLTACINSNQGSWVKPNYKYDYDVYNYSLRELLAVDDGSVEYVEYYTPLTNEGMDWKSWCIGRPVWIFPR